MRFKNGYAFGLDNASMSITLSHTFFLMETYVFISSLSKKFAFVVLLLLLCTLSQHMSATEQLPKPQLSSNVKNNIGKTSTVFALLLSANILCVHSPQTVIIYKDRVFGLWISQFVIFMSVKGQYPNKLRIKILYSELQY